MRILNLRIVVSSDDGGVRQVERQYIPELKQSGVDVIGVVLGNGLGNYADQSEDFQYCVDAMLHGYRGGMLSRLSNLYKNHVQAKRVARSIYNYIVKSVDLNGGGSTIINISRVDLVPIALVLARLIKGRVVFQSGSSFKSGPVGINYIYYWWLRRLPSLKIVANSKFSARGYRLKPDDYVYPGVDYKRISGEKVDRDIRKELGIEAGAPVFLYLARISWEKAPDLLLKAFLESKKAGEAKAHLIIVGTVQNVTVKNTLEEMIERYSAGDRIHVVGPQADVANWYASADIFVNSQRGIEAFGISIVEAMVAGLPILTSALGGPSETVKDQVNGWLVYELTADGYQESIDRVMLSRGNWRLYGAKSKELSKGFYVGAQVHRYIAHCTSF